MWFLGSSLSLKVMPESRQGSTNSHRNEVAHHQAIVKASTPTSILKRQTNLHHIYSGKRELDLVPHLMIHPQRSLEALFCLNMCNVDLLSFSCSGSWLCNCNYSQYCLNSWCLQSKTTKSGHYTSSNPSI